MAKVDIEYDALSFYKTLGVGTNASNEDIRLKYRDLVKIWHPDHNSNAEAIGMFQRISQAYEVLKSPQTRSKYDMLSLIYTKDNFPDMNALLLLRNLHGQEDLNLRAFRLIEVTGLGLKQKVIDKTYYCSQYEASTIIKQITKHNWLLGFWGIGAFFYNIKAIVSNILNINNQKDNLLLTIHNALVYEANGRKEEALTSLCIAKKYANKNETCYINNYIKNFENIKPLSVKEWNFFRLKRIQLYYPFIFLMMIGLAFSLNVMRHIEKSRNNETSVKEEIIFRDGRRAFSDVAVAKIFDIPVDVYDKEKLYHTIEDTNAMHGADDGFDIYQKIVAGTTVRITGQTVDNKWLRVMFDNGEMAFIKASKLKKGIGNEIPLWSKIYKEN